MQSQAQIDQVLRQKCDAREIPGVVAMAANGNEVIYQGAFGKRDLSKDDAMTADSVFWIASMTKAITTAAGMQLVEQGKLSLDEPIGKVLPDLASPQVLEGFDASGAPKLRPATQPITLRHLMTHTAGFCYDMWNGDMVAYLEKAGMPPITTCQNAALKTPLMTDPGTRWEYGTNIDFVGKAVEAVSGKRLDAYLRDHLLAPLGMTDTAFKIGDAQRQRLVGMHARGEDGSLAPIPFELEQDPEFHMGGGGLYGTAGDYIKFTQMILNKGRGNGNQVLKPETVALMGQNHIGDLNMAKMISVAPAHQRRRSLSRHGQEMGAQLPDQHRQDAGRPQPRQPRLGRPRQHLFLDRPGAQRRRRDPDAGAAVRRREVPGSVRGLRARRLCRARCRRSGRRSEASAVAFDGTGTACVQPRRFGPRAHSARRMDRSDQTCSATCVGTETNLTEPADSYVCGVADAPLLGETIGHSLDQAVRRWADREALVSPSHDVRWTWRELAERVDALAAGFLALGLERGARIGIWSPNRPEWTLTQFATAKAGLILVNINPAYRLSELEYALTKVGCAALVTATAFKTTDYIGDAEHAGAGAGHGRAGRAARGAAAAAAHGDPDRRPGIVRARSPFERGRRHGRRAPPRRARRARPDRCSSTMPINIQFTSGTTGSPKGATLTHHNILNNGYFVGRGDAPHRARPHLHPGAALSLLRHGDGQPRLRHPRRGHGLSRRGLRSAGDAADRRAANAAPRSTACRPCSSPSSTIPTSPSSICRRCAPASWPARPARSR